MPAVTINPDGLSIHDPAPIGGINAASDGGCLVITPRANLTPPPTGEPPSQPTTALYDVLDWKFLTGFANIHFAKGGMMGAISSRRSHYVYTWDCTIKLDLRNQPEFALRPLAGAEIYFQLGRPMVVGGRTVSPRYLWCPVARVADVSPLIECEGKKIVRQHLTGTASGHAFILPDLGILTDVTTRAGAYLSWLGANPLG